ncbi:MAG: dipeptide epimerase [Bacteroidales bacterium]|nr:dipeptide epimerase [Bacteroidales bacterium]
MKITGLEVKAHEMRLSEPYDIFYEQVDRCTNVFIQAHTDTGHTGYGCAAPDQMVTGETAESVLNDYKTVIEPVFRNADPFRYVYLLEELQKNLMKSPSAMAMADMLLFDLIAKYAGVPLYKYLGGFRTSIPTSITIGIMSLKETINKANECFRQGFTILKLKGGKNVEEDIEKIIKLREKFGESLQIRFDANQGYDLSTATRFFEETRKYGVELLEQPTPRKNHELLGSVSDYVTIPVMADESIMNLRDVFRLTSNEFTDMINIKLMKVGGINEALHINSVAKAAGVESMIGCMDESGLAIAAGLHFCLARSNVIFADLDGHFDLIDDPGANAVILKQGVLFTTEKPGLGFDLDAFF